MKTNTVEPKFEINIANLSRPTPKIAVTQSMNTLLSGDILKVSACSNEIARMLIVFCQQAGYSLLLKLKINNLNTLFIRKN